MRGPAQMGQKNFLLPALLLWWVRFFLDEELSGDHPGDSITGKLIFPENQSGSAGFEVHGPDLTDTPFEHIACRYVPSPCGGGSDGSRLLACQLGR